MDINHQESNKTEQLVDVDLNKFQIHLTNLTGTYFHHLNEYCLLEIFSVKSLDLSDVCSIAETCERFQRIIQRVIPKRLSIEKGEHEDCYFVGSTFYTKKRYKTKEVIRFFKNFGSLLSSLDFSRDHKVDFLLKMLATYCDDNLNSLSISRSEIPRTLTVKVKPNFKRLQILQVEYGSVEHETLFAVCDSLVELRLSRVENCGAILKNFYPKLERFSYDKHIIVMAHSTNNLEYEQTVETLSTFISRHSKLRTIALCFDYRNDSCMTTVMQAICNSCEELEEFKLALEYYTTSSSFPPMQALKMLRTLQLSGIKFEDFNFCSHLTDLGELKLYDCNLPMDLKQYDFLAQLTKLELENCYSIDKIEVVNIVRRLIKLEVLTITKSWCKLKIFELDEETFSEIVGIVNERPNVLTLKCECNFIPKNYDQSQNVRVLPIL